MITWHVGVRILGTVLIVGPYLMILLGRIKVTNLSYSLANMFGSSFQILSIVYEFNLGALVV